jgi:hypothetical protein
MLAVLQPDSWLHCTSQVCNGSEAPDRHGRDAHAMSAHTPIASDWHRSSCPDNPDRHQPNVLQSSCRCAFRPLVPCSFSQQKTDLPGERAFLTSSQLLKPRAQLRLKPDVYRVIG